MDRRNWRSVWARSPTPPPVRKPKEENSKSNSQTKEKYDAKLDVRNSKRKADSPPTSSSENSSSDNSDDSEEDRKKKKKSKSNKKHKKEEKKHKKDKKHKKSKHKDSNNSSSSKNSYDDFTKRLNEKTSSNSGGSSAKFIDPLTVNPFSEELQAFKAHQQTAPTSSSSRLKHDDSDDDFGPAPMTAPLDYGQDKRISYGEQLLPGEGAAIAQYVQQNLRIPRRGEIGWSGDVIETLENQGYVMSGSRHARMNAVRLRKENQVYSAEEKRALAFITMEEKAQKDNKIVGDFRAMLTKRLAEAGIDQNPHSISNSSNSKEVSEE